MVPDEFLETEVAADSEDNSIAVSRGPNIEYSPVSRYRGSSESDHDPDIDSDDGGVTI